MKRNYKKKYCMNTKLLHLLHYVNIKLFTLCIDEVSSISNIRKQQKQFFPTIYLQFDLLYKFMIKMISKHRKINIQ